MKKLIILFLAGLFTQQIIQAQGTIYLSSLNPSSTSSLPVASDYWLAAEFGTGPDASGYLLDSIQLGMTGASGNPNNFTVLIYSAIVGASVKPGSSLGTLDGPLNPVVGDIYTYTPAANLTLSPNTDYFIVLTSGTTVANGAYEWSESAYPPVSSDGWKVDNAVLHSNNGTSGWSSDPSPYPYSGISQFAISATPVPEPGVLSLLGLGGAALLWRRLFNLRVKETRRPAGSAAR